MRILLLLLLITNALFLNSLEIISERKIDENQEWKSFVFYDNSNIAYSKEKSIFLFNINKNSHTKLMDLNAENIELNKKDFGIALSRGGIYRELLINIYESVGHVRIDEYYKYNKKLEKITKNEYNSFIVSRDVFNISSYPYNWYLKLLGSYIYSFEGEVMEVIPYIKSKDNTQDAIYFINTSNIGEKYYKPFDDSLWNVDISPDRFRISFWGWTTEDIEYGATMGEISGLFIFRIIYDGIMNSSAELYNISETDGTINKVGIIDNYSKVNIHDIQTIGNQEYYQVEQHDVLVGWVLKDRVDIGLVKPIDGK